MEEDRKKYHREYKRQYREKNKEKLDEYNKEFKEKNAEHLKEYQKNYYSSKQKYLRYGINREQYDSLLNKQNNKCSICGISFNNENEIRIDHDHDKNIVRGLLCHHCNCGLGLFKDDINVLTNAINYLNKYSSPPVVVSPPNDKTINEVVLVIR
jgi:hypothetical protein